MSISGLHQLGYIVTMDSFTLLYSHSKIQYYQQAPLLLWLSPCAGEDAVKFESLPNDVVVAKAISVLRSIFGDQTVPEVSTHPQPSPGFGLVVKDL